MPIYLISMKKIYQVALLLFSKFSQKVSWHRVKSFGIRDQISTSKKSQASHITFLRLNFLICKIEMLAS